MTAPAARFCPVYRRGHPPQSLITQTLSRHSQAGDLTTTGLAQKLRQPHQSRTRLTPIAEIKVGSSLAQVAQVHVDWPCGLKLGQLDITVIGEKQVL